MTEPRSQDTPQEYRRSTVKQPKLARCRLCGCRLPAARDLAPFTAEVLYERARLALLEPEGEKEATHPLDAVKARALLLHLAEQSEHPRLSRPTQTNRLNQAAILERLGCDLSRDRGLVRCPAHADKGPSLSWAFDGERALLHCFAGCSFEQIAEAVR